MTSAHSRTRRAAVAAVAAVSALALAACGSESADGEEGGSAKGGTSASAAAKEDSSAQQDSEARNEEDVTFAKMMIPHHEQAVEMAELAPSRASSAEVKDLAEKIKAAQAPEIETMSKWLTTWGEKVPKNVEHMEGMEHGAHGMPGMMTTQAMKKLEKESGAAFDKSWLVMMIEHHEGALAMAETEQKEGAHGPSKDLAGKIVKAQTAEIARMKKMLDQA